jgi:hypothetical protein
VGLVGGGQGDLGGGLGADERELLAASFRDAYTDGLIRGLPLAGVLGGDQVHGWPASAPLSWVQNWRTAETAPNSWGIPSLVLAIRGLSHNRVFIVRGGILDFYGRSGGAGGANGAAGYGAPCGDEFVYPGGFAQRFDRGLIGVDDSGRAFFRPEEPPSAGMVPPEKTGVLPSRPDGRIRGAFLSAWKAGVDRGLLPLEADDSVVHIAFPGGPWMLAGSGDGEEGLLALRNLYYQSFDGGRALIVFAEPPQDESGRDRFPGIARLLTPPFLDAFLGGRRLPGAGELVPDPLPGTFRFQGAALGRAVLEGVSLYGLPLGDAMPRQFPEEGPVREAQRFSRGWMVKGAE